jgi:predicted house-cleaning noncanonical NTP pyrophosphatase (MazG superfamily)
MSKIIYNKLVRDNIPAIIKKNGGEPKTRILGDEEYKKRLDEKLQEEVAEYLKDDNVEEIADIYEVITAILKYKSVTFEEFEKVALEKRVKKGGFEQKIFLEEVN